MCKDKQEIVCIVIPKDLSCTGQEKIKMAKIDKCIAPIVRALQVAGINMRGSCCGHGKQSGEIILQDGRSLVIKKQSKNGSLPPISVDKPIFT